MKLLCETQLYSRLSGTIISRWLKNCTLALVAQKESTASKLNVYIFFYTPQNKSGTRYKLENNIHKVFHKFVNEGKCTLGFKNPEHDIFVRADTLQLKCFLTTLSTILQKASKNGLTEELTRSLRLGSLSTTAIDKKHIPIKKITITCSSQLAKQLPTSLEQLKIENVKMLKLPLSITNLKSLTSLSITDCYLTEIPNELGNLRLHTLKISNNNFSDTKLEFLSRKQINESLRDLNLFNNNLKHFPKEVVKMNLVSLNVGGQNEYEWVPISIRRMKSLKKLSIASKNIGPLPSSMKRLTIDFYEFGTFDFHKNTYLEKKNRDEYFNKYRMMLRNRLPKEPPRISLFLLAARVVLQNKLPLNGIPETVKDVLLENPLCEKCDSLIDYFPYAKLTKYHKFCRFTVVCGYTPICSVETYCELHKNFAYD